MKTKSNFLQNGRTITKVTAWSRFLVEKLTVTHPLKKFPTFYDTAVFITTLTRSGFYPEPYETNPQLSPLFQENPFFYFLPYVSRSAEWSLPFSSFNQSSYAFIFSPMHGTTFPTHLILLDLATLIFGEVYKLWSSSLGSLLKSPAMS